MEAQVVAAIGCAFDPRTEIGLKQRATAFCEQAKAAPGAWRFFLQLLAVPASTDAVLFFSLGALQETLSGGAYEALTTEERCELRVGVVAWMRDVVHRAPPLAKFHTNKLAVVVAQLVQRQILTEWPNAFDELQAALLAAPGQPNDPQSARFFLRVFRSIDEEIVRGSAHVVAAQRAHNNEVKDAMRRTCVPRLVGVWCGLVEEFRDAAPGVRRLASKSLSTMQLFIVWINLDLVANDRVLRVLYGCASAPVPAVGQAAESERESAALLQQAACACLSAVVMKGMPEPNKLALLERIRVASVLSDAIARCLARRNGALQECLAQLLDTVGQVYVHAIVSVSNDLRTHDAALAAAAAAGSALAAGGTPGVVAGAEAMRVALGPAWASLAQLFQLSCACMGIANREIVWCVLDFIALFGHFAPKNPIMLEILNAPCTTARRPGDAAGSCAIVLLRHIHAQLRYPSPPAYDFDNPVEDDDKEREFGEFRADVRKIFTAIVRLAPHDALGFMRQTLSEGGALPMSKLGVLPFADVEAMLEMLVSFSDRGNHTRALLDEPDFMSLLVALHGSTVAQHPHHCVLMAYMELSSKCVVFVAHLSFSCTAPLPHHPHTHPVGGATGGGLACACSCCSLARVRVTPPPRSSCDPSRDPSRWLSLSLTHIRPLPPLAAPLAACLPPGMSPCSPVTAPIWSAPSRRSSRRCAASLAIPGSSSRRARATSCCACAAPWGRPSGRTQARSSPGCSRCC